VSQKFVPAAERIVRHALIDRLFHWIVAAAVLVLLGTAFLPVLGFEFPWVMAHWIAGFVLTAATLFHIVRAAFWQELKTMWIGVRDIENAAAIAAYALRLSVIPPGKTGKYTFAQKLIHHVFTLVVLTAIVTGCLMMVRIDTPWWDRNPFWLSQGTWGWVYVLHGLSALLLVTMVICHVYFALRPEKKQFLRAMILGWITRAEYRDHHDQRWQVRR
jgi:cytochrome b subunit of formate dehydrogenase